MSDLAEVPAYNSRLLKIYTEFLEPKLPADSINTILKNSGITNFEVNDPGHWFTQKQVDDFYDQALKVTNDPQIARKVGRYVASSVAIGLPRQLTLGLLSLKAVYTLMGPLSNLLTRSSEVKTRDLGPTSVEIINTVKPGFTEKPYQCENRLGIYESIGKLFSDNYAEVTHPECIHRGDSRCRYEVKWPSSPWMTWRRWRNWFFMLSILAIIICLPIITTLNWKEIIFAWCAIAGMIAFLSEHFRVQEYAKTIRSQAETARDHIRDLDLRYNNALMVQEIGQATATICNEDQMVVAAAKSIEMRTGYDRGIIMLADTIGERLCYSAGFGYDDATKKQLKDNTFHLNRPDSKGIFVKAFREKKPLLIQNMDEIIDAFSERSKELAKNLAGKSMICVPIAYEEQVVGIFAIDNSDSERPLTQSDVNLLMGVASQLAVGIVNTRAYAKLESSEKKYRDLVENAHSIILRIDPVGRIIFFNKFAQELFGYSESQVFKKSINEVIFPTSPGAQDWIDTLSKALLPNRDIPMVEETSYTLENGLTIWIAWTYRPIFSTDGKLLEILCIGNDITQLKQTIEEKAKLEIQLIRAQKMEALGTLAGGVAHDLNNVLTGIIGYPELMLMLLPEDSPLRRYATSIQKSGERAAAIVQDLLTLARRNVVQAEIIDLNNVVTEYIGSPEFERLRLNHPLAKITTRLDPQANGIMGSPVQLSKAVMNLMTNAIEALEGKEGEVTIITEICRLAGDIDAYERIPAGVYVRLTVLDTGCGMAPDDLRRIFEPFFSRKKMGCSGTGLGMAVVWGTIKDHSGLIDVHSTPGKGTRFDIYFPPTDRKEERTQETPLVADIGNGEKVLMVDDEASQREIAHGILTDLGYHVRTVPSGEAAIERLKKEPADLVILDMIMDSGMDGLDSYRQILLQWPSQRAIIASGSSDSERVHEAMRLGVGQYVKKPYNKKKLAKAVRQELDRPPIPPAPTP
ncbi:MAG: response regulator [Desulfobacteraceae bacterium]|nr:response regulator [Desulfobacteraceae bacterium]